LPTFGKPGLEKLLCTRGAFGTMLLRRALQYAKDDKCRMEEIKELCDYIENEKPEELFTENVDELCWEVFVELYPGRMPEPAEDE